MSFKDKIVKTEYRSLTDDVVNEFYIPLLNEAISYKRAVGFFSSSALIEISKGISGLIRNGGKIQLIASPKLSEDDIEAIEKGFEIRKIIESCIENSINDPINEFEEKRLNLLANLIANGQLDIKIAFLQENEKIGMFHEKMGVLEDSDGNFIAFSGSMNESKNAFSHNYEAIDVFCSWTNDLDRVNSKKLAFNSIWNDYEPRVNTIPFPDIAKEVLKKYRTNNNIDYDIDLDLIEENKVKEFNLNDSKNRTINGPKAPIDFIIRPYQLEAINIWENKGFVGIFDMATGTGKTFTGLAACERLFEKLDNRLAIFIVCPYQHLVNQWQEDVEKFGMKPILGHSASVQTNWKDRLKTSIASFNLGITNNICFISTNATFSSDYVQKMILKIKDNLMLIADEAHNFGAENLSHLMPDKVKYRLALSATIERHGDEEGTKKIYEYFGDKCIEYTLKEAIREKMLCPYNYYPVVVSLSEEELNDYIEITKKIFGSFDEFGKLKFSDSQKMLLIKRARIVAGAVDKIRKLKDSILKYKDDNHMLVYCGTASIIDTNSETNGIDLDEKRQIDIVVDMLGNELSMRVSKFTSEESADEREKLKTSFDQGQQIQALVAIKCLDEGINIPSIKRAYILASSTNPKEYIQRRGRVLRLFPGKTHADIYDFITLPVDFDLINSYSPDILKSASGLLKREIDRMKEFAQISMNPWEVDGLIKKIEDAYKMNIIREE